MTYFYEKNHLSNVKMNYYSHLKRASKLSYLFLSGGVQMFIHAIFPNILHKSGSNYRNKINDEFNKK